MIGRQHKGASFATRARKRSEKLIVAGILAMASVTANSTTMALSSVASGRVAVGQTVNMPGVPAGTTIAALGTSTGGAGTVTLSAQATLTTTDVVSTTSRTGLVGEYLFGRDAETSKFNLCGGPNLSFVGAPVFDKRFVTFNQNAWADTLIPDNQELTLLIISAMVGANVYPLVTNFNGGNPTNTTCFNVTSAAGQITAIASASDDTQVGVPNYSARIPATEYTVKVLRTTGAANFNVKVDEYRAGARVGGQSLVSTKTRKVTTAAPFAIGSSRGAASFAGTSNVAGAAIWHRALTDQELLAIVAAITTRLATFPNQAIVV